MKYLTGNEIRQKYLDFFKAHGHLVLPVPRSFRMMIRPAADWGWNGTVQTVFYREDETAFSAHYDLPKMCSYGRY